MALTASQFLSGTGGVKDVVLIAGPRDTLRHFVLERLISDYEPARTLRPSTPPHGFLTKAVSIGRLIEIIGSEADPIDETRLLIVYGPVDSSHDLRQLEWYSQSPLANVRVVCWTRASRDSKGEDWFKSWDGISVIKCRDISPEQMVKVAVRNGMSIVEARTLVNHTGDDFMELRRVLDLLSLAEPGSAELTLSAAMAIDGRYNGILRRFFIQNWSSDQALYAQVYRRLLQMVVCSSVTFGDVKYISEFADRIHENPTMAKELRDLALTKPSYIWFDKMAAIIRLGKYMEQHVSGVQQAMMGVLA